MVLRFVNRGGSGAARPLQTRIDSQPGGSEMSIHDHVVRCASDSRRPSCAGSHRSWAIPTCGTLIFVALMLWIALTSGTDLPDDTVSAIEIRPGALAAEAVDRRHGAPTFFDPFDEQKRNAGVQELPAQF
jgi:hypothetical protein